MTPSMRFIVNAECPQCGKHVGSSVIEPDPNRYDFAFQFFECADCGNVGRKEICIRPPMYSSDHGLDPHVSNVGIEANHASASAKEIVMKTYQGKNVTVVRDARAGDPDYAKGSDQVIVRLEDGTEKTVARADVK